MLIALSIGRIPVIGISMIPAIPAAELLPRNHIEPKGCKAQMAAGQPAAFFYMRGRIEAFHFQAQPVQAAGMEIPDLETVHGGVRQSGIVDGGAQCSTAAFHVSGRAAECDAAESCDIGFSMMEMVLPITPVVPNGTFLSRPALLFCDCLFGTRRLGWLSTLRRPRCDGSRLNGYTPRLDCLLCRDAD